MISIEEEFRRRKITTREEYEDRVDWERAAIWKAFMKARSNPRARIAASVPLDITHGTAAHPAAPTVAGIGKAASQERGRHYRTLTMPTDVETL